MTPLVHAEQAVLGAVLLEPGQLDRLSPWLRPEQFSRPAHTAIYAAMLKLKAGGHPAAATGAGDPVPLAWVTDTLREANTRTRGLTASYLHSLASACPRPDHASVYGRMVLEGAIHRSVAQHAVRLHQAALADGRAGTVEETLHHTQVLTAVLTDLARGWGTEARPVQPPATYAPRAERLQPVGEQVLADEEYLLGCLASRPEQLLGLVRWLRPGDFADPGHQQIYRALGALHHRGEPIDQLTVLWETQRRGALADGTLDAERVRRICDPLVGGSAEHFGEQVVQASLVRTAASAARQVSALADRDALAPGQLIGYAMHALGPLDDVGRRLRHAHEAEPEPRQPVSRPGAPPPAARVDAARARSRVADPTAHRPPPSVARPALAARPNHRSPS
ncbi:DnaB-like helicase N-terminal domain-containing protein [Streptomyces sp. CB03238]|uniref:DnaB-like helicase N-terminal domain-containing protein n=1 Tax=Streptomyces sp. CB03238 TaxID=1907777 RepID=UPI000A0FD6C6|nr:DnaB-like helicase N-terminal domain-containing protein [Streptomyces sp. CB03238]ORT59159.1 helicase DnaB [Streptomyces sp. CB03238]